MRFGRKKPVVTGVYRGLRKQALSIERSNLGATTTDELLVLLMETGYPDAVVTLAGFADGTTSLYFSNGGGVIGAGSHEAVVDATLKWLEADVSALPLFEPDDELLLPAAGTTQFIAVTERGRLTAGAPENTLGEGGHPLSPLFYAAQDVIGQIRLAEESS